MQKGSVAVLGVVALFFLSSALTASAASLASTLDVGSTGTDVAVLQTYLAMDTELYPEGLVTGYYGPLTRAAVERFQCREEIVCAGDALSTGYGRVGPLTRARLNELMVDLDIVPVVSSGVATGTGGADLVNTGDTTAPIIQPELVSAADTTATIAWMANEPAYARVYFSTMLPIYLTRGARFAEGTVFGPVQQVTLAGLTPNTTYYYVRESRDMTGNTTLTLAKSFMTGNAGQQGTQTGPAGTTTNTGGVSTTTTTGGVSASVAATSTVTTTGTATSTGQTSSMSTNATTGATTTATTAVTY